MSRFGDEYPCSLDAQSAHVFGDSCELIGGLFGPPDAGSLAGAAASMRQDVMKEYESIMQIEPGGGRLRQGAARVLRGAQVAFTASPPSRLGMLLDELARYLEVSEQHPLILSSVFHYQFLCIHPFDDGNGRVARRMQEALLRRWRPPLACLDIESAVTKRKDAYLESLSIADRRQQDAGAFVTFMLCTIRDELRSEKPMGTAIRRDPTRIPEPVERLLAAFGGETLTSSVLMKNLHMSHRGTFRKNYLDEALELGLVEMTQPDAPRSPTQRYRLTTSGRERLKQLQQ